MHSFLLEDWVQIGGGSGAKVTQEETRWLDLSAFQDVVFYLDCRAITNSATIAFETAPAKDEALFQTLASTSLTAGASPTVLRALMATSSVPLARYVRWKITGGASAWSASFRVFAAANSPGM